MVFVRATTPQNAAIWIADANGRHARRLARGYAAVVSPDGRTIAVGRWDGIHLVSSDGKRQRRLTHTNIGPEAWSPDGRWIIAATDTSLAVIDADSGRMHVVARGAFFDFDLSGDRRRLVYARAPRATAEGICGARMDLYAVDLSGGRPTRLTHDGRSAFPVWGRNRIAFARLPKRLHFYDCFAPGIWTLRPDGSRLRAIVARAPRALSHFGYYGLQPVAWLRSGDLLVGVHSEWGNEAALLDAHTGRLRQLALDSGTPSHRVRQAFYVDKASRDGRLALGDGGNEKVTISIIRLSDGRPIFALRGSVCCPDWNR